jgi:hypothetical protein
MLVTPGTEKSNGGTSTPSLAKYGSTHPPMHASTWHRTPARAAAAAISGTGSTTPCAYEGALATTSTVSASIAAAIRSASARNVTGSTGTATNRTPK